MKIIRKMFFLVMLLTVVSLTACSDNNKQLFKEVYDNMNTKFNYVLDMKVEIASIYGSENVQLHAEMDMESEKKGTMKMTIPMGVETVTAYVLLNETSVDMYMNTIGEDWEKTHMSMTDFLAQGNSVDNTLFLDALQNNSNIKSIKDITLPDNTKVKLFEVTLNARELFEEAMGEEFGSLLQGVSADEISKIFDNIVYKMYVDVDAKLIRRVEVNMLPVFDKLFDLIQEGMQNPLTKASITLDLSKFNEVVVEIPQRVIDEATEVQYPF